jgi:hypothetical protein
MVECKQSIHSAIAPPIVTAGDPAIVTPIVARPSGHCTVWRTVSRPLEADAATVTRTVPNRLRACHDGTVLKGQGSLITDEQAFLREQQRQVFGWGKRITPTHD